MRRWSLRGALALMASLAAPVAQAQAVAVPFGECRTGYWHSSRNLDDDPGTAKASCLVNWKQALGDAWRMNVSAHAGVRDTQARASGARLKEAYLEAEAGSWRWRLGRQIIAWGRADRINPTDSLSARDFTLLVPEDEEQRLGIDALAANYRLADGVELTGVAVPRFTPHRMPQGSLPPNRALAGEPDGSEWALKVEKSGGAWDGALSIYDGYERQPRYRASFPRASTLLFSGFYERKRVLGADLATTAGGWNMRAEFAASRLAPCDACPSRSMRQLVLGVDRDVGDSANINAQLFAIWRPDFVATGAMAPQQQQIGNALDRLNSEFGKQEHGVTLRVSDRYWNDGLKAELAAIVDLSGHSSLWRPRVSYSVSDVFKLTAGIDYFHGREQSYFGVRSRNRLGFVELAYVY